MIFDVAIIGGGLVGATLARALDRSGWRCVLIEGALPREPHPDAWDSRVYALSPSTEQFLRQLEVWPELDSRRLQPVRRMRIFGDRRSELQFTAYDCAVDRLATIVETGLLQHALWRSFPRHRNLNVLCPARPEQLVVGADHAEVTLSGGHSVSARLVVGADGAQSWVREAAGFAVRRESKQLSAVVANFECGQPHHETAWQWFNAEGVLAWLPLPGKRMSMVWSTRVERARSLVESSNDELCTTVAAAGRRRLGELAVITPPRLFPIAPFAALSRVQPRVALVGDAAHVIHPLAGQGVNLGFGDAQALAEVLGTPAAAADPGSWRMLRRFERQRAEAILAMRLATSGLERLFCVDDPVLRAVRNFGLNLTDRVPVLKGLLARRAL
jgi:ubiquinone biosynthesis UbiH/UbiF/VisC/COQ6 family hydroxylase